MKLKDFNNMMKNFKRGINGIKSYDVALATPGFAEGLTEAWVEYLLPSYFNPHNKNALYKAILNTIKRSFHLN